MAEENRMIDWLVFCVVFSNIGTYAEHMYVNIGIMYGQLDMYYK